jgi:hypothetical protein
LVKPSAVYEGYDVFIAKTHYRRKKIMFRAIQNQTLRARFWLPLAMSAALLTGCGTGSDDSQDQDTDTTSFIRMDLPDSLTGGTATTSQTLSVAAAVSAQSGGDVPCAYIGVEDDDPFRNGYQMTKFMVSAVATWSCIADVLIEVAEAQIIPHDGTIHETDNDTTADNYDASDPTHFSITDDSDHQTTIRMYYGYDRDTPPVMGEEPQFFISWVENTDAEYEGRLVISSDINPESRAADDPAWARMDFHFTGQQKVADMFLRFDEGNPWAEGLRIRVTKDLTANALEEVFTAQGKMEMKAQFIPVDGVDVLPTLDMYTVSDKFGNGAAVAEFVDVTLPLELNATNDLGDYLFSKEDKYVFDLDGDPDWIYKVFSAATYEGGRTTPATGGTVTNPSLDMISGYLFPGDSNYFDTSCNDTNPECVDLLNKIFEDGFADQEQNQGSDPTDWRSAGIASPDYLDSVYPNGSDWTGAFDFTFTPTLVQ